MIRFYTIRINHLLTEEDPLLTVCKILKNVCFAWSFYLDFREMAITKTPSLPLGIWFPIPDNEFIHIL